jgi:hypothetical protein
VSIQTTVAAEAHSAEGQALLADIEHKRLFHMPSRSSETNSYQNRRAEFGAKADLSKEQCIKMIIFYYVRCAILSALKEDHCCNGLEETDY